MTPEETRAVRAALRKQKKHGGDDSDDDWLMTYSDAVTLLMTFLVLLLSVSSIDQSKYDQVVEDIKEGGLNSSEQFVSPFEKLKTDLDEITEKNDMKENMTVVRQPKGITIELASSSLYKVGSADIQEKSLQALTDVAASITNFEYENYQVEIEGHTDNVAIHTQKFPSNWELSVNRATNIVQHFLKEGVDSQRMKAAGYADTKPKAPNTDEKGNSIPENQAMNRRVIIHVIRKDS